MPVTQSGRVRAQECREGIWARLDRGAGGVPTLCRRRVLGYDIIEIQLRCLRPRGLQPASSSTMASRLLSIFRPRGAHPLRCALPRKHKCKFLFLDTFPSCVAPMRCAMHTAEHRTHLSATAGTARFSQFSFLKGMSITTAAIALEIDGLHFPGFPQLSDTRTFDCSEGLTASRAPLPVRTCPRSVQTCLVSAQTLRCNLQEELFHYVDRVAIERHRRSASASHSSDVARCRSD